MTMAKKVLLKPKKVAAKKKLKPKAPAVAKFNEAAMHTVFDTETTGLVTNRSIKLNRQPEVIEFFGSLVDLSSGKVAKQLHRIIQPTVEWPMTEFTIKQTKTKLSNDLLSDKPKFKEVSDEIKHFLEGAPALIAHNISFDKDMIEIELERLAQTINWPKTCICTVEQTLHLRGHRLNLTRLHEFLFNEPFEGAHRAEDDVNALTRISVELYRRQLI
jgi:DNA polymerase-3 subunit alpha